MRRGISLGFCSLNWLLTLFLLIPHSSIHAQVASKGEEESQPNIILMMGFSDLGCYEAEIPTPHLYALGHRQQGQ